MTIRIVRSHAGRLAFVLLVAAGAVSSVQSLLATPEDGCCGVRYDPEHPDDCSFNQTPFVHCQTGSTGDAKCYAQSENFPHCCFTDGWCGS